MASAFVSYLRVSTERQGRSGLGLEAQRRVAAGLGGDPGLIEAPGHVAAEVLVGLFAGALCVVAPFLAEVLSSNVTPWGFFLLSWGLIPVYGFPALLLREWAIRYRISLPGLLLAGFGYGLYNEGLIAKTIFLNQKVPWNLFDGRIGWGGVNWGWLLVICIYHALFSIVTPILLVEKLRPQTANQTWLSKRSALALFAAIVLISTCYHSQKPVTLPIGFYLLWGAIALSVLLGSLLRGDWQTSPQTLSPRALVWIGAFCLPSLLLLSGAFAHGLPFPVLAMGCLGVALFGAWNAWRGGQSGTLVMGLGAYAGMSAMNVVVSHPVAKVVGAIAFAIIVWSLRKKNTPRPAPFPLITTP